MKGKRLVETQRRLDEVASRDHATGVFGTSHNACALAYFDSAATLGAEGVPMGPILSGGGLLCYDPFVIYNKRERFNVTNPNMAVTGELGQGKSTTVQIYLRRQHPFGRFIRVIDPSPMGEYHALCDDLNGQKIRVAKDGDVTLNPLESPVTRHALLRSMAAATTGRPLKEREPALLNTALDAAGDQPILPDVLDRLFYPTAEMAKRVGTTERQFAREARDLSMSLLTLCEGDLRGLFDGHTTADVDFSNRFILLDLSDLHDSQSLGILMACATSFLQAQIDAHYHQGQIIGQMPKSILVIDEAWKILALPGIGEWLIERIKFARKKAEQTVAIFHGLRDLDAAGDEGNRITKLAQGLVKDCGTFVIHKASMADARALQQLLNLSEVEYDVIVRNLDRGCALWRIGQHRFVAFTHATEDDLRVTSPDRAMTG